MYALNVFFTLSPDEFPNIGHSQFFFIPWEPIIWNSQALDLYVDRYLLNLGGLIYLGYFIGFIGFLGLFLYRQSILYCLLSIELFLIGLNVAIIFIGALIDQPFCQVFVLILLTLAAAETALGLSLVLLHHKLYNTTTFIFLHRFNF